MLMLTFDDWLNMGIPLNGDDTVASLHAEAALDWMQEHTTLEFDKAKMESIAALPACAKVFIVKYVEVLQRTTGMISQSIEGMSMSFDASEDISTTILKLAQTLLQNYLRSQVQAFPAKRRW